MGLPLLEKDLAYISKLDTYPNDVGGMSAEELKAAFDAASQDIQNYINKLLIPQIESDIEAAAQGVTPGDGIDGERLNDNSVPGDKIISLDGEKIEDGTIGTEKHKKGSITRELLSEDAKTVQTEDLPNKVIPGRALDDNTIPYTKYRDGSVTGQKIADGAVTEAKIANKAITLEKLADDVMNTQFVKMGTAHDIVPSDQQKKVVDEYANRNVQKVITLNATLSAALPAGFVVAITSKYSDDIIINVSGIRLGTYGFDSQVATLSKPASLKMKGKYGTIVLEKYEVDNSGDLWIATGNLEVL